MNISGPNTALVPLGSARLPAAAGTKEAQTTGGKGELIAAQPQRTRSDGRPVRMNRYPEEAALFAYSKQAQPSISPAKPQVDEYV